MYTRITKYFILFLWLWSHASFAQWQFQDVADSRGILQALAADTHGSGVAVGDVDNDGDADLYLCTAEGSQDMLFINNNGQYTHAQNVGLSRTKRSRMALWVDINADGLLDIVVAGDCDMDEFDCPEEQNIDFYLQSNGNFVLRTDEYGLTNFGANLKNQTLGGMAAGDLNLDGYIDLVVAIRNGPLLVFMNQEGQSFLEQSRNLGINTVENKYYQPFLGDLDNDGDTDIFCNVDFGPNELWINSNGYFSNQVSITNANNAFNEMGVAVGDYDNDGDFDMYSTNIENYFGNDYYNTLLKNKLEEGTLVFEEVAKLARVNSGGWGWGTTFFDGDNDGYLDLVATNGWDLGFEVLDQTKFWHGSVSGIFNDTTSATGLEEQLNATTMISLDYDNDGDLDLIQTIKGQNQSGQMLRLLENNLTDISSTSFVNITLQMAGKNIHGIGSRIEIYQHGFRQIRPIHSGISFYGQEAPIAHFGLLSSDVIDSVKVFWPGGAVSRQYDVAANQDIVINDSDVIHAPSQLEVSNSDVYNLVEWNDYATNETGYQLERSLNAAFGSYDIISLPAESNSYLDEDTAEGVVYYY